MIEIVWFLLWLGTAATNITACPKVNSENMLSSSRHIDTSKLALGVSGLRRPESVHVSKEVRNRTPIFRLRRTE